MTLDATHPVVLDADRSARALGHDLGDLERREMSGDVRLSRQCQACGARWVLIAQTGQALDVRGSALTRQCDK